MNVVVKVGSIITQGMYSVATPFHPFGGAVDIIVVKQHDGTFRSTPWYVRFGKFQGVLKGAEKIVRIEVNGVEANFHMYLDNSGEAYFVREVDLEKDDNEGCKDSAELEASINVNDEVKGSELQRSEANEHNDGGVEVRDERVTLGMDRLERADSDVERIFYEFQDDKSSLEDSVEFSEYGSGRFDNLGDMEHVLESQDSNSEVILVSVDGHILTAPISLSERNAENVQLSTPQFHLGPGEGTDDYNRGEVSWPSDLLNEIDASHKVTTINIHEADNGTLSLSSVPHLETCNLDQEHPYSEQGTPDSGHLDREHSIDSSSDIASKPFNRNEVFKSCMELQELASQSTDEDEEHKNSLLEVLDKSPRSPLVNGESEEGKEEISRNNDGLFPQDSEFPSSTLLTELKFKPKSHERETSDTEYDGSVRLAVQCDNNDPELPIQADVDLASMRMHSGEGAPASEEERIKIEHLELLTGASIKGLEISLCGNLLHTGMGSRAAEDVFHANRVSLEEFKFSASSILENENLILRIQGKYLKWEKAAHIILGIAAFGLSLPIKPQDVIPVKKETPESKEDDSDMTSTPSRRWRLWPIPFRRVKTLEHTGSYSSNEEVFVNSGSVSQSQPEEPSSTIHTVTEPTRKQIIRTNVPTIDQIASLNLKEGQNMVSFIFSTRVLGSQKVEAHIYLWKWNTRIVISDVDGTITRSDVLGQFMPLVGRDWTHSGIARLFSAIKENGYQLLFLSARAIVQAYLTKSFLFNLKQDGKSLPNGPVVISPDGLFPSLFREVIRRAPHEFKIACLEDIKALFPSDYNPFYAGFGNRDTDELSYRKIGIPKGKIFIINPKGEVAINHRIDVKSYTSLHTLVNDMFPPASIVEQEDFNSWNYWKTPLPEIEGL
ncbi:phosphatidate phosphatase PAH1-like [Primulina huaijiensis]|uniref:phosphatidate phosphatase PAH1-like n=1 Tax=Primulina huaijiensis TaxID=1492673 RepID=UPI003CC72EED